MTDKAQKKPDEKMPAGAPWMKKEECPPRRPQEDPVHPRVDDPPVPNRAHTEMRTDFPPEMPNG